MFNVPSLVTYHGSPVICNVDHIFSYVTRLGLYKLLINVIKTLLVKVTYFI